MENSNQENPQPKLPKIEAFKAIQKQLAIVGFGPKTTPQSHPFNGRILRGFLALSTAIIALCVYIFNDAETFLECMQSIYIASDLFLIVFALIILIIQKDEVFEFINRCESVLNASRGDRG